jgi:hypothetical protein
MKPANLIQILSEIVMLIFGLLLVLLALSGRFVVPRQLALWITLGALMIIWGLRTWVRRGNVSQPAIRAMQWVRSVSLVLAGAVMIAMIWMPFESARSMLAVVGGLLTVRGLACSALIARSLMR